MKPPAINLATGADAAAAAAFQAAGAILALLALNRAAPGAETPPLSAGAALGMFFPLAIAAALAFRRARRSGVPARRIFGAKRPAKEIFFGASAGLLMMPVAAFLTYLTLCAAASAGLPPPPPQRLTLMLAHSGTTLLAKAIAAAAITLAAPAAEELLNRWAITGWLAGRFPAPLAAAISALFFAALHLNVASAFGLFALGMVFAALYLRSGSLLGPIAAHIAFNLANLAFMLATANL